jgi:hypothetical protein
MIDDYPKMAVETIAGMIVETILAGVVVYVRE